MDIEQLAGTKQGNYKVESLLGMGGIGVVYEARQIFLKRPVALKVLPPNVISDSSYIMRFHREAEAITQLHHANIVQVHDSGEGQTLDEILKEKDRLDIDKAVRIVSQAVQHIARAHKSGIIHRAPP